MSRAPQARVGSIGLFGGSATEYASVSHERNRTSYFGWPRNAMASWNSLGST